MAKKDRQIPTFKERCCVCGSDRANGYHYGVASCCSCKTFFRRCTEAGKTSFVCHNDNRCSMHEGGHGRGEGRRCRACRYRLCVESGMDASLIVSKRIRTRHPSEAHSSPLPSGSSGSGTPQPLDSTTSARDPDVDAARLRDHVDSLKHSNTLLLVLRLSSFRTGGMLDQLARPPLTLADVPMTPGTVMVSERELMEQDLAIYLEYIKMAPFFGKMRFTEQLLVIENALVSIFLFSRACYGIPVKTSCRELQQDFDKFAERVRRCDMSNETFLVTRELLLLAEMSGYRGDCSSMIEESRESTLHDLLTLCTQRDPSSAHSRLAEFLHLIGSVRALAVRFKPIYRAENIPIVRDIAPEVFMCC